MKYLDKAYNTEDFQPMSFWIQSESSEILQKLLSNRSCDNNPFSTNLLSIAEQGSFKLKLYSGQSLSGFDWQVMYLEQFFSYLLLNLGYFTSQVTSNRDNIFSIPNTELLREFTGLIPNDNEYCRKILYHLHKTDQIKILELIRQHDHEGIKKELSQSHIKCEDKNMNFNFFQLASIFGDKKVFQTLLESKCKEHLDFANDKLGGLKAIDYAFILGNDQVMELIQKHYPNNVETLVKIPGWSETVICYPYQNSIRSRGASGTFDFLRDIIDHTGVKLLANAANVFRSVVSSYSANSIEEKCNQYDEYKKIDISNPTEFNSLKQFEKYLLHNKEAQIVVNSECEKSQKKLSEVTYSIFENSFYSDEELIFTLCGSSAFENSHSEL